MNNIDWQMAFSKPNALQNLFDFGDAVLCEVIVGIFQVEILSILQRGGRPSNHGRSIEHVVFCLRKRKGEEPYSANTH